MNYWKACAAILIAPFVATAAHAQDNPGVPAIPDEFLDFERRSGDRIVFCLNENSAIVEFDRAVSQAIADSLLLEAEFRILSDIRPALPLDYRFTLSVNDMFVYLNNDCDVIMGYALPQIGAVPEWLIVSRPYFEPRFVLAVTNPDYERLEDIPSGAAVGSRLGTHADSRWRSFTRSSGNWEREVFSLNDGLLGALDDGAVEGAIIWEPALYLAANEDPDLIGATPDSVPYTTAALPFELAPVQLAGAMKTDADFLRSLVDMAIEDLVASGAIEDMLEEFGLPPTR